MSGVRDAPCSHRPKAPAWSSPREERATSMSRAAMSMKASPWLSAWSRATLPALSPWRTSIRRDGQDGVGAFDMTAAVPPA